MVACIDFFEMSEICRPKFIVRHSTHLSHTGVELGVKQLNNFGFNRYFKKIIKTLITALFT
jgi:hypothetical protein